MRRLVRWGTLVSAALALGCIGGPDASEMDEELEGTDAEREGAEAELGELEGHVTQPGMLEPEDGELIEAGGQEPLEAEEPLCADGDCLPDEAGIRDVTDPRDPDTGGSLQESHRRTWGQYIDDTF